MPELTLPTAVTPVRELRIWALAASMRQYRMSRAPIILLGLEYEVGVYGVAVLFHPHFQEIKLVMNYVQQ